MLLQGNTEFNALLPSIRQRLVGQCDDHAMTSEGVVVPSAFVALSPLRNLFELRPAFSVAADLHDKVQQNDSKQARHCLADRDTKIKI